LLVVEDVVRCDQDGLDLSDIGSHHGHVHGLVPVSNLGVSAKTTIFVCELYLSCHRAKVCFFER